MLLLDGEVFFDCNKAAMEMMGCTSKRQMLLLSPSKLSPEMQPDGISSSLKADSIIKYALKMVQYVLNGCIGNFPEKIFLLK